MDVASKREYSASQATESEWHLDITREQCLRVAVPRIQLDVPPYDPSADFELPCYPVSHEEVVEKQA
jgi:hypothetical protein